MMRQPVEVVSIDTQRPVLGKLVLGALYKPTRTPWKFGRINRAQTARVMRRSAERLGCDAVVTMANDDAPATVPTFAYQDMNFSVALHQVDSASDRFVNVGTRSPAVLRRMANEQRRNYDRIAGILAMSQWFADWLVEHDCIPRERVHVVGGGINHPSSLEKRPARRGRLLFIGEDFHRKAGDELVTAVELLRTGGHNVTLTIAGPRRWPMSQAPPTWIRFLGHLDGTAIGSLWSDHDLLVLPSRFEAYGIVFSEARAAGLPCVGRRAFAMPELIADGGALVEPEDGPETLAQTIAGVLADDALYDRVWEQRAAVRRERSWDAVASRVVAVIRQHIDAG